MSADLVPFLAAGGTAADKVAVLARVAALKDVVDERVDVVRAELEEQVRTLAELAGGQFTGRFEAGMAYVAGGNPKPRITSASLFGEWAEAAAPHLAAKVRRVMVVDDGIVAEALDRLLSAQKNDDQETAAAEAWNLADYLKVEDEWVVSSTALDELVDRGRCVVNDEWLWDAETGEPVPGVTVTYSREGLTVKPDKKFRKAVADELRDKLGALPAGGDA